MIEEESRKSRGRVEEGSRKGRGRVEEESRKSRGRVEEGSRKGRGRVEEGSRKSRGYTIHDEKPVHVENDSPWKFAMLKCLWHCWCKGFAGNKCDYILPRNQEPVMRTCVLKQLQPVGRVSIRKNRNLVQHQHQNTFAGGKTHL